MSAVREQDHGYRRGLVLGLTLAEIAVLIIFVLLLVLGALFARQTRDAEKLRERIVELEAVISDLESVVNVVGSDPQKIATELASGAKARNRLELIEKEAARLKELEAALNANRPSNSSERSLPDIFRELVLLRDAIANAGIEPTPSSVQATLAAAAAAREALENIGDKEIAALVKENTQLKVDAENLDRETKNLKSQMANLRKQAEAGGKGLDHPPCWADSDGYAEYIFDIALTTNGLIVRDRDLPHREADRATLPLSDIVLNEEVSTQRFRSMTLPLFNWSVEHECRFVVRAFDTTAASDKSSYKRHMRELEQRFYKYEVLNEEF